MPPAIPISGYTPKWSDKRKPEPGYVPGCIPYDTDFYLEMERIKNGHYRAVIEKCRAIEDKKLRGEYKSQFLPALTLSAVCRDWRKTANVVNHTGLMNVDIDDSNNDVEDWGALRDTLAGSALVVAAFLSASGKGLSLVFRIHPEQHYDAYRNIQQDLKTQFGILADSGVHDVVRLRFVSYDPEAYINYDFDSIPIVELTPAYIAERDRRRANPAQILTTGAANSTINFANACRVAEQEYSFTDGQKHFFLVVLAGYCNTTGMDEETCCRFVLNRYGPECKLSDRDLLEPIRNVYRRYSHQFGETPLRRITVPVRHLKWLLGYIEKDLLRKYLDYYGQYTLIGETYHTIRVDSPLLAFFMWIACPEYTWTTTLQYNQVFTIEDCKSIIQPDALIDSCNGNRVWIGKQTRYPLNWDK